MKPKDWITALELVIGRAEDCHVRITDDPYVSPRHAKMTRDSDGNVWIEDMGSTNGISVNGVRVQLGVKQPIKKGDVIRVGRTNIPW